jgi:uncharacterized membrane protein YgcG
MRKLTLILAVLALPALAQIPLPPAPERYVTDRANVLDDARELALNERLAQYDRETSNQVIVYVDRRVPAGTTLEEMGAEAIRAWKVGQRKLDNGAILFLFIDDRQSRIEVGYGLEGVLTDARSKRILVGLRTPLRAGDYATAVERGAAEIIATITPPPPAKPLSSPPSRYVTDDTHVLDDARAQILNDRLAQYERETANRLMVRVETRVPVGTTADAVAATAIAKGDFETEAILMIFAEEGQARIAVGESLRDRLTEARVNRILLDLDEPLRGRFYSTAAERAVGSMIFTIAQPYAAAPPHAPLTRGVEPRPVTRPTRWVSMLVQMVVSLLLGLALVAGFITFVVLMFRSNRSPRVYSTPPPPPPRNDDDPWPQSTPSWTSHDSSSSGWSSSSPSSSSSSSSPSSPSSFSGGGGSGGGGGASDSW